MTDNHLSKNPMSLLSEMFEDSEIRLLERSGQVWVVAKDVAKVLGYRDAGNMTRLLKDDEKGTQKLSTLGGTQHLAIINEAGVYRAIFSSNKPAAETFKHWVLHDLLPTLRRTGFYSLKQEVVSASMIARAYAVQTKNVPHYMKLHKIHVVGQAENPETGKPFDLYPRQLVLERFMLGSGMRDGVTLRSYSAPWQPLEGGEEA